MVYDIEFICHAGSQAEALAVDVIRIIGSELASVVAHAEELFRTLDIVPRPTGFRIREVDGPVVHEFEQEHHS
jgi:hypothetical protein